MLRQKISYRFWLLGGISLALLGLLAFQLMNIFPLLFPEKQFPYQLEKAPFTLYSDTPIGEEQKGWLRELENRLAAISLDQEGQNYDIYVCAFPDLYTSFAQVAGKGTNSQGFHVAYLDKIFLNLHFIQQIATRNKNRTHQYNFLEGNPVHIMAHEITHQLLIHQLGMKKYRKLALWKQEGLCEYFASLYAKQQDTAYHVSTRLKEYQNGKYDHLPSGRMLYIEGELVVGVFVGCEGDESGRGIYISRKLKETTE